MIVIRSMQDDDSLLRRFVTIKPAAEKILSDGTDVDGTAKYRRARTESLEYVTGADSSCTECLSLMWFSIFVVPSV